MRSTQGPYVENCSVCMAVPIGGNLNRAIREAWYGCIVCVVCCERGLDEA